MKPSSDDRTSAPREAARAKWAFAGFLVLAAFYLVAEHRAHLLGALPWLLLLACPLMHLFMHHGGHRHGHGGHDDTPSPRGDRE